MTRYNLAFEDVYCLTKIPFQPDEYDGPTRYCKQYACRVTEDEWNERYDDEYPERRSHENFDGRGYHPSCTRHGRSCNSAASTDHLRQGFANLKHGMYAEDWRLREDFSEEDRALFDYIMGWAEIYGWPSQDEDPARYEILEMLAFNRVRSARAAEWFQRKADENDDGEAEIEYREVRDDEGVVIGEVPVPNTLSEDLRLLHKTIIDQMKELGLTPKSRGEMDLMESETDMNDVVGDLASKALSKDDHSYDPSEFGPDEGDDGGG